MTKTDIFDEIIRCLADGKSFAPDTSMDPDTARAFFMPADRHAPKAKTPVTQKACDSVPREETHPADASAMPADSLRPTETSAVSAPSHAPAPVSAPTRQTQHTPIPEKPPRPVFAQDPRINADMDTLRELALGCRTCKLCETRTNVVFEDGNRQARLMFIGEGPGADEDAAGVPFVGRAGQLLTKMIQAMTFDRARDVYIANIVKCRPPSNRNPEDDEAAACLPFLRRQIELVHPDVIVLLGAIPLRYLLGMEGISKVRGQWLDYNGIKVMATYHPAFLLRNPRAKIDAWADLQKVMAVFGRRPVPRS